MRREKAWGNYEQCKKKTFVFFFFFSLGTDNNYLLKRDVKIATPYFSNLVATAGEDIHRIISETAQTRLKQYRFFEAVLVKDLLLQHESRLRCSHGVDGDTYRPATDAFRKGDGSILRYYNTTDVSDSFPLPFGPRKDFYLSLSRYTPGMNHLVTSTPLKVWRQALLSGSPERMMVSYAWPTYPLRMLVSAPSSVACASMALSGLISSGLLPLCILSLKDTCFWLGDLGLAPTEAVVLLRIFWVSSFFLSRDDFVKCFWSKEVM